MSRTKGSRGGKEPTGKGAFLSPARSISAAWRNLALNSRWRGPARRRFRRTRGTESRRLLARRRGGGERALLADLVGTHRLATVFSRSALAVASMRLIIATTLSRRSSGDRSRQQGRGASWSSSNPRMPSSSVGPYFSSSWSSISTSWRLRTRRARSSLTAALICIETLSSNSSSERTRSSSREMDSLRFATGAIPQSRHTSRCPTRRDATRRRSRHRSDSRRSHRHQRRGGRL